MSRWLLANLRQKELSAEGGIGYGIKYVYVQNMPTWPFQISK